MLVTLGGVSVDAAVVVSAAAVDVVSVIVGHCCN